MVIDLNRRRQQERVSHTAEASELGWKPGEVRQRVNLEGQVFDFSHAIKNTETDETIAWYYVDVVTGHALTVYND